MKLQQINGEPLGHVNSFITPAAGNNMVYVGADGHVFGFGVTSGAALHGSATSAFPDTTVGSSATKTFTATASQTVTVTGISNSANTATDPFTVGTVTETGPGFINSAPVTFPVTLHRGDRLRAPVTFAPTLPGGADGTLSFNTAGGQAIPVNVSLIADATQTGLYATTTSLTMLLSLNNGTVIAPVPVGTPDYAATTIVNGGATPQKITKISLPGGPFSIVGLPKVGTVLQPGQTVTVQFAYIPSKAVTSSGALTVTGSSGTVATVSVTGSSSPALSRFTRPHSVSFGSVPVGRTVTQYIKIINAGNQPALISSTSLTAPFRAAAQVPNGLPVSGGADLNVPVTFTPTATGYTTGNYVINWTDRFGPHQLTISVNGTGM